jgi:hypothetical protein
MLGPLRTAEITPARQGVMNKYCLSYGGLVYVSFFAFFLGRASASFRIFA